MISCTALTCPAPPSISKRSGQASVSRSGVPPSAGAWKPACQHLPSSCRNHRRAVRSAPRMLNLRYCDFTKPSGPATIIPHRPACGTLDMAVVVDLHPSRRRVEAERLGQPRRAAWPAPAPRPWRRARLSRAFLRALSINLGLLAALGNKDLDRSPRVSADRAVSHQVGVLDRVRQEHLPSAAPSGRRIGRGRLRALRVSSISAPTRG